LSFLHRMTQEWKDEHIAWYIAESPVWSGSPMAVYSAISGYGADNLTSFYREMSLRIPSLLWLFPRAGASNTTWGPEDVIITTPHKNYSAADYAELLGDLGLDLLIPGLEALTKDADLGEFKAPMVDTLVTYGYGLGTPGSFSYGQPFVANASIIPRAIGSQNMSGDTIVPVISSLRAQYEWAEEMAAGGKKLLYRSYSQQQHALCCIPQGGSCFDHVVALLTNGTIPPEASPIEAQMSNLADLDDETASALKFFGVLGV